MSSVRLALRQSRLEQLAFWRNPEAAFFTAALPIVLLLIFGATSNTHAIPGRPDLAPLTFFVPGILAFGIIVAAYNNLANTISILRGDGVLKRIRATPLQPEIYLAGHLLSVVVTSLAIAAATIALGRFAFDISPPSVQSVLMILVTLTLGVWCFAALGLAISSFIPDGFAAGAITNGTFIPLAILSGTFSDSLTLPQWLERIVAVLPIKPLTEALHDCYDPAVHTLPWANLALLALWGALGAVLATRYFRWESR